MLSSFPGGSFRERAEAIAGARRRSAYSEFTRKNLTEDGLEVAGKFIPCRVKIWAAGNTASSVGKTLGLPVDKPGRVIVQDDLTIPGHP